MGFVLQREETSLPRGSRKQGGAIWYKGATSAGDDAQAQAAGVRDPNIVEAEFNRERVHNAGGI